MYQSPQGALPDPMRQPEFYASVPSKRLFAFFIDFAIVTALMVPLTIFTFFAALIVLVPAFVVVNFLYRWVTLANGSATLGMRMMAIEFRDAEGRRLDGGIALLHCIGFALSWSLFLVQLVSMALMGTTSKGQGLTDMVLGTVVINRRA